MPDKRPPRPKPKNSAGTPPEPTGIQEAATTIMSADELAALDRRLEDDGVVEMKKPPQRETPKLGYRPRERVEPDQPTRYIPLRVDATGREHRGAAHPHRIADGQWDKQPAKGKQAPGGVDGSETGVFIVGGDGNMEAAKTPGKQEEPDLRGVVIPGSKTPANIDASLVARQVEPTARKWRPSTDRQRPPETRTPVFTPGPKAAPPLERQSQQPTPTFEEPQTIFEKIPLTDEQLVKNAISDVTRFLTAMYDAYSKSGQLETDMKVHESLRVLIDLRNQGRFNTTQYKEYFENTLAGLNTVPLDRRDQNTALIVAALEDLVNGQPTPPQTKPKKKSGLAGLLARLTGK